LKGTIMDFQLRQALPTTGIPESNTAAAELRSITKTALDAWAMPTPEALEQVAATHKAEMETRKFVEGVARLRRLEQERRSQVDEQRAVNKALLKIVEQSVAPAEDVVVSDPPILKGKNGHGVFASALLEAGDWGLPRDALARALEDKRKWLLPALLSKGGTGPGNGSLWCPAIFAKLVADRKGCAKTPRELGLLVRFHFEDSFEKWKRETGLYHVNTP
jgi:hypothetical protein